jgi:ABC-type uncharacterized transport system permease subunit
MNHPKQLIEGAAPEGAPRAFCHIRSSANPSLMIVLYAVLCVIGAVLPYTQFVPFVLEHGLDVSLLVSELFANRISSFFAIDVLVSTLVLWVFVVVEARRAGIRNAWLPLVASLLVGVSLALPLFLLQRERAARLRVGDSR